MRKHKRRKKETEMQRNREREREIGKENVIKIFAIRMIWELLPRPIACISMTAYI